MRVVVAGPLPLLPLLVLLLMVLAASASFPRVLCGRKRRDGPACHYEGSV